MSTTSRTPGAPVAIVGIGCRFPDADDAESFWANLRDARTSFRPIPADRWTHAAFFNPSQREVDKTWTPNGSFIEDFKSFAALHYGIAPRRLEVMDPQQRLLIEATRVAIQDAGYEVRPFDRRRTGVFVGISVSELKNIASTRVAAMQIAAGDFGPAAGTQELRDLLMEMVENVAPLRAFSLPGALTALAAASISQTFDLGGPSYAIDAACASASVGINDAIVQLRAGVIDHAVAGGVYLNLVPDNLVSFTRIGAISPTGVCRPFDARADGFVQSDGVGILFLKRLEDALRDDDRIYAVIRGTGCNNDGRGEGPMTPRVEGQLAVLESAYADAGLSPAAISYFEAHGTATAVGDPVEVEALGTLLARSGVSGEAPALIGSVKGNIGHAMSAAGIAGVIKAIKVLEHRTVPPQAGFERPNPVLGLERYPLEVNARLRPLEGRGVGPARVAVSSFGFGGTNSHLILEAPPERPRHVRLERSIREEKAAPVDAPSLPEAVLVTAPNASLLAAYLDELAAALDAGSAGARASLADVAYTLNARRRRERVRAVVGARTVPELIAGLRRTAEAVRSAGPEPKLPLAIGRDAAVYDAGTTDAPRRKLAFMFPGQGAQKTGLLDHLRRRFPKFSEWLGVMTAGTSDLLPRSLTSYLYPDAGVPADVAERELTATEVCQPAMAALGLSLAALLREAGVEADVSLGHSLGEFVALANAGAIDPVDAVRLVAARGRAMSALALPDPGTMAAAPAPVEDVRAAIAGIDGVWIANVNQPRQVSISGTHDGVEAASRALAARGIEVRPLSVSHAFHTPLLEGIRPAMTAALDALELAAPAHLVVSCVSETPYSSDVEAARATMLAHATAPVDFVRALHAAREAGATVFVNAGAGPMLAAFARATLGDEIVAVTLSPAEDDGGYELIRGLATLAACGVPVDFEAAYAGEGRRVVDLPATPLERERYWIVKDRGQPRARLDHPLPEDRPSVAPRKDPPMANDNSTPGPSEELVRLFAQQAEVLRQHAEIIAAQTRLLSGLPAPATSQLPVPSNTSIGQVAGPVAAVAAAPAPAVAPVTAPPAAEAAPVAAVEPAPSTADVRDRVFEIVARISAFPRASLRAEQRLVDELGFDSLMVADLGGAIESAFPSSGGLPQSLFSLTTTVGDVADHIAKVQSKPAKPPVAAATAKLAPARRYTVVPCERPRRSLGAHDPRGETWLLTGAGPLPAALAKALAARGAKVVSLEALKASSGVVHGFIHAAGVSVTDAGSFVNPVLELHPLVQQHQPARFAAITALGGKLGLERSPALSKNVLQAALLGYTKSLARERPQVIVRAIDVDPAAAPAANAEAILDELLSGDLTTEVGLAQNKRWVAELAPVETPAGKARRAIGKNDVVLITGGAGELGAITALDIAARRPKGIILTGRRPADEKIQALLARLIKAGTKAAYIAADVTSASALENATRSVVEVMGPVTMAIHAAGAIEDAPAPKKSLESIERVMNVKVLGVQSILRAFPALKDLIVFTSWAGRFGNAGQTDYAAANELVAHLAVAGAGNVRVVAIDWPPWSSTAMVRSIPTVIQNAMKAEGVTFLEDEEGTAVLNAIIGDDAGGIEVVGRELPRLETRARRVEVLSPEAHPYLDDHRLKGRPVLPLASALDLMAHTAGAGDGPVVVEDLELVRGLVGGETAIARAVTRVLASGAETASVELRVARAGEDGEAVAYRARIAREARSIAAPALDGEDETLPLDLESFYRDHTFHGPRLVGVVEISRMTARGISGTVRASSPAEWMPGTDRTAWAIDPLVVDGSFQLAAYWAHVHLGKAGFPTGFERLTLLRPFGAGPVRAVLALRDAGDETFEGDIWWEDASGAPIGLLEKVRGRFVEGLVREGAKNGAHAANGNGHEPVPPEHHQIELFPELEALDQRFQMAELIGLKNPYFHVHAGTARNRSVVEGEEMLNFSSYNYLGFSGHPEVIAAAKEAIDRYGTSVSASRVASGERPIHRQLEEGIAAHIGVDDSIVFVSGHATNVTTIGHLFDRSDLILHDSLIHDSILQGIYLSGATRRPFPHNDLDAAERAISQVRKGYRRVLLCAEGIYSMDGDTCDLPRLIELKKRYQANLLIDEAHSIGVLGPAGRGVGHHFPGVDPRDVDLWMGTLSKSFASCGGYIAGSKALVRYLKYTAPGFVYSAGITPPNAASALKALELMQRNPEVVETLRERSRFFLQLARSRGIDCGQAIGAAVIPVIIGNSLECMRLAEALARRHINVQPIVYPAVEDNASRLRFFISATHSEEELRHTVEVIVEEREKVRAAEGLTSLSL